MRSMPRRLVLPVLLMLVGGVAPAVGAPEELPTAVPDGARLSVAVERRVWFLGETVILDYRIENAGATPFLIDVGGDYRGASRHLRVQVEVRDATGALVADPDPTPFCLGGVSWRPVIERAGTHHMAISLGRHARIEKPGRYHVRVFHDLGWDGDDSPYESGEGPVADDPRWASIELDVLEPSAEEAAALLARMADLPREPQASSGDAPTLWVDYGLLRHPVYLPLLEAKAAEGDENALAGIASIATPEATALLLSLLERGGGSKVAGLLNLRLPDPELSGELPARHVFLDGRAPLRRFLVERAWRSELAPRAKAWALTWLEAASLRDAGYGVFVLEALGVAEDLPAVTACLDRILPQTRDLPFEAGIYPRPRGALAEMARGVRMLLRRGAEAPSSPTTPGEALVWLLALEEDADGSSRPEGWEDLVASLAAHDLPYLRESALRYCPRPVPAVVRDGFAARILDPDLDVRLAAVAALQDTPDSRYVDQLLDLLGRGSDETLLRAADEACRALGVTEDVRVGVWVERLADEDRCYEAFARLWRLFDAPAGHGWSGTPDPAEREALRTRWRAFLETHRERIRDGRLFGLGEKIVTEDLFPTTFRRPPP